jgi:hypothetical protein
VTNGRALPLWAWREYVTWVDQHIEKYKQAAKKGVLCVHC